jgi:predicted DNA-binding WGR domain protein
MRIYLQTPPGHDGAPRYYHLFLQQDLLEGWTLVKEYGAQGSAGRVSRIHFSERETALTSLLRTRDEQIKRGYRVVFVKGEEAPV